MKSGDWKVVVSVLVIVGLAALLAYGLTGNAVKMTSNLVDSDGGVRVYLAGSIIDKTTGETAKDSNGNIAADNCITGKKVLEYYLDSNGGISYATKYCKTGCNAGACVSTTCNETALRCYTGLSNQPSAQQCNDNKWQYIKSCPGGCANGMCNSSNPLPDSGKISLNENTETNIIVKNNTHTIKIMGITQKEGVNEAVIVVDGMFSRTISEGFASKVGDLYIYVKSIFYSEKESVNNYANLIISY